MFCKYCGENNVDGAKFCKNCGKPLMTTSSADGTAAGYNPGMTRDIHRHHSRTIKDWDYSNRGDCGSSADRCSSDFFNFPCGKRTQPGKTVDQLVTSLFKLDADGIIDTFPKEAVNKLKEEGNWDDEYDDLVSGIESLAQSVEIMLTWKRCVLIRSQRQKMPQKMR